MPSGRRKRIAAVPVAECFIDRRYRRIGKATISQRRGCIYVAVNAGRHLKTDEVAAISRLFEVAQLATAKLGDRPGPMLWRVRETGGSAKGVSPKVALGLATRLNAAVGGQV